ncbi:MAG TPA: carboxypeptidase-like regulatory domain-containing protein [Planctomycetota bacterium]|nr:carboxypeptidase-like regulatory domain-containing protein [Planctomycetota bacterium]
MKLLAASLAAASLLFAASLAAFILLRAPAGGPRETRKSDTGAPGDAPGAPSGVDSTRGAGDETGPETGDGAAAGSGTWAGEAIPGAPTSIEKADPAPSRPPIPRGSSGAVFELQGAGGAPLIEAVVMLQAGRVAEEAVADLNGLAVFSGIEAGSYTFRVTAPGFPELLSARQLSIAPGETRRVALRIGGFDLAIAGRVLDQKGKPIPGILLFATKQLIGAGDSAEVSELVLADDAHLRAESAADGSYEIAGLDAADYVISAAGSGAIPSARRVFRAGTRSADIVLGERREIEVHGMVVSSVGAALSGVRISFIGQPARQTESDVTGHYLLVLEAGGTDGVHVLTGVKEGFRDVRANVRLEDLGDAETWEVPLVMDSLGEQTSVTGIVVDEESAPIPGETVHLHSASLSSRANVVTGPDGRFAMEGVQVGKDYRLWIYPRKGYRDLVKTSLEIPREGLDVELVLEALETSTLRGVMVDPAGAPVTRFTLWVRSLKALGSSRAITSDDAGRFEVEGVPQGDILFETRSAPRLTVRGVTLSGDALDEAAIVLDRGPHSLRGTVVDETRVPVAGASVTLFWTHRDGSIQSTSYRSSVTDAAGSFAFSELAAGEHRITVSSPAHTPLQAIQDVGGGGPEPVLELKARAKRRGRDE